MRQAALAVLAATLWATPFAVSAQAPADGMTTNAAPARQLQVSAELSPKTVPLWPGAAPGALGNAPQDIPTLTIFPPDGATPADAAVIVAPAGGYRMLESGKQGREVADWFAAHGITAFVLSYRLVSAGYLHPTELHDAQRAIRWVRAHASDFGVAPDRIGMIGFSAGGHLTGMAETLFDAGDPKSSDPVDRMSSRPDFAILCYAALNLDLSEPAYKAFAGPNASPATMRQLSPVLNVTAQTPPTFILQTTEDRSLATDATAFYNALFAAHVPVEAHIFEKGAHGAGLGMTDPALRVWPILLENWLAGRGLLWRGPEAGPVG